MNYKILILFFSIQLAACSHAESPKIPDGTTNSNNPISNWSVLIQRLDKKIVQINFQKQVLRSTWRTISPAQFKTLYRNDAAYGKLNTCYDANYTTKQILCRTGVIHSKTKASLNKGGSDALINLNTFNIINKDIKITGRFSMDGRYIISDRGIGIYDIKTKKIITAHDKKNQTRHIIVVLPNTKINTGFSFTGPTMPTSNGDFVAGLINEEDESLGLIRLNLYDIIKNKGYAKSVTRIKLDFHSLAPAVGEYNYVGKNTYLLKVSNKKSIGAEIKGWTLKRIYSCNVNPDHTLAICWTYPVKGSPHQTMYVVDIKKRRVVKKYEKTYSGKVFWLWKGDPKKFTGYKI